MSTAPVTKDAVVKIVGEIERLSNVLPKTVPIGKKTDKLYQTLTGTISGESTWATFNRRMDILYGEDCRDGEGRLQNVRRGAYRIGVLCTFLTEFVVLSEDGALPYDLVKIKLDRLLKELVHLTSMASDGLNPPAAAGPAIQAPPLQPIKLRIKLPGATAVGTPGGPGVGTSAATVSGDAPASAAVAPHTKGTAPGQPQASSTATATTEKKASASVKKPKKKRELPLDKYMKPREPALLPDEDEPMDKSYQPPKRPRVEPPSPTRIYGEDGEELFSSSHSSGSESDAPHQNIGRSKSCPNRSKEEGN
ncbi:hypothetical protein LXA43DRAFT_1142421 [Ganoderma leucocontextum]|nr:hypothetical protein LXA43DRAFT_1142421 [Ganoderma leucocontextum]